ncbi:bifunctional phosphopantothenoylcysteine decarboxylase/phosphopantothenate--cysteine ligase CoaBC [Solemya velesiana gill symbiont]|uniref:Coenzyme A biosynthesis bifunctional protein CoaBC n=1 Tax=Solemya velesiana gill symbiont TaxID=1918948 RepID=A0A1T2KXF6_9GAMM|nr:bifunctional phosphopantothenoylcysteine decarboxylase/phosphopantothenate--cysteine ligase CoaBC [Solemya velesiana gill symbiont]OOZ37406.1 bifunctional 4'-phosphopantothenoylcysteine decarboxylase/phosphopantothenoylcysteine synthetase [Solemya velesiana gill symbiont]
MSELVGKRILLGITGGIAAYKSAELVRLLTKVGADVRVVMTEAAGRFITSMTLQALSGHPVRDSLFDEAHEAAMGHIELARWADLILMAPATADFMARISSGMADDLLATLCLAARSPIALAPAMNQAMWLNPATRDNARLLAARGMHLWGPAEGDQACGDSGPGRMLEPQELLRQTVHALSKGPLSGVRVLMTAGPTQEPLDPVRYIGNRSSGKMGYALARAFISAGADVVLVSGPVSLDTPAGVERVDVETALEMEAEVSARVGNCDIFVACAAVADYRPVAAAGQKIKKAQEALSVELIRNPDILAGIAARPEPPYTVGFAAETQDVVAYADAKRIKKGLDMIAANHVGGEEGGFGRDQNALTVLWEGGSQELAMTGKQELGRQLVALIAENYGKTNRTENT